MNLDTNQEDFIWIKHYQKCDHQALNRLIKKYYTYIYKSFVYKGIPHEDAKDFTQDLCVRLMRTLKGYKFDCQFKTYLDRSVTRMTIDYYKRTSNLKFISLFIKLFGEKEDAETILLDKLATSRADEADQQALYNILLAVVQACLELITNRIEKLVLCLWLDGHQRKNMAEILDIPLGTVHSSLERGKQKLRDCVTEKYFD